jgi:hypothetical protein
LRPAATSPPTVEQPQITSNSRKKLGPMNRINVITHSVRQDFIVIDQALYPMNDIFIPNYWRLAIDQTRYGQFGSSAFLFSAASDRLYYNGQQ